MYHTQQAFEAEFKGQEETVKELIRVGQSLAGQFPAAKVRVECSLHIFWPCFCVYACVCVCVCVFVCVPLTHYI